MRLDRRPERPPELPAERRAAGERLLHGYARLFSSFPHHPRAFSSLSASVCCEMWLNYSGAEFELGLELDSAEVRGILIQDGQDWGHVVFDFRI